MFFGTFHFFRRLQTDCRSEPIATLMIVIFLLFFFQGPFDIISYFFLIFAALSGKLHLTRHYREITFNAAVKSSQRYCENWSAGRIQYSRNNMGKKPSVRTANGNCQFFLRTIFLIHAIISLIIYRQFLSLKSNFLIMRKIMRWEWL